MPPAGWYTDPDNKIRWWDGAKWTRMVHGDEGPQVLGRSTGSVPSAPPEGPSWSTDKNATSLGTDLLGPELDGYDSAWQRRLEGVTVLGGSGFPFRVGEKVLVTLGPNGITLKSAAPTPASPSTNDVIVSYKDVVSLDIGGPGTVTSGGGVIGGGFGLGAAIGIGLATVANALTTKSATHTFITVATAEGELFCHYSGAEPKALRILLSPGFVALRNARGAGLSTRN